MTVYNIPRYNAENNELSHPDACWISIHEPTNPKGGVDLHITNEELDKLPNLKVRFWDIDKPLDLIGGGQVMPPSEEDAAQIVDFLLANKGKEVIVNCRAGISRSGAVALFCQDVLKYHWDKNCKSFAIPNMHLYRLMVNYYINKYEVL